jgi:hypothetical protein
MTLIIGIIADFKIENYFLVSPFISIENFINILTGEINGMISYNKWGCPKSKER